MRKVIVATVLLIALLSQAGFAQSDRSGNEKLDVARELIALTSATDTIRKGFEFSLNQQKQAFLSQAGDDITPERKRELDLTIEYLGEELDAVFPEFFDQVAALYAEQFSLEDLKEVRDFFKSDVGRRYTQGGFELGAKAAALGQEWFKTVATDAARRSRARAIETMKSER
jgi:hypothetical protein